MEPWNGTCPACGNKKAYQGFFSWECPETKCKYFTEAQNEMVVKSEVANIEPTEDSVETIPCTPAGSTSVSGATNTCAGKDTDPYFPPDPTHFYNTGAVADDEPEPPDPDWTDMLMDPFS